MGVAQNSERSTVAPQNPTKGRVLVVDDSRMQRRILTLMLKRWGYDVVEADSGQAGLQLCEVFQPDMVLSDWMMPGMNGLEFCRAFRDLSRDSYGYFILLTSKSDKAEVALGLESGADDFLTKPVNAEELRARLNAGKRILSMERELKAKTEVIADTLSELQTLYNSLDKDLQQARVIQTSLIPETVREIGKSRVSLMLKSCGHVGGDLVGVFGPENGEFGMFSLDVSGHGITSAMITSRVAGYLSDAHVDENLALAAKGDGFIFRQPEDAAFRLNDRMTRHQGLEEYLTIAYLRVNARTGRARFVQAGHPPPLILRADGSASFVGEGGLPVGLIAGATYEGRDIQLSPGDRVLLYSDGLTEARLPNGALLEEEGLRDLAQGISATTEGPAFLDALYDSLREVTGNPVEFDDDVSAALLEFDVL